MKKLNLTLLAPLALVLAPAIESAQDSSGAAGGAPNAPPSSAEEETPTMFRLHSGGVLWGTLRAHSPEGVEVVRLDTGGLARMPWSFLDPSQAEGLRLLYGYDEVEGEELMVDAERIRLNDGSEVVGVVDGRTDEHLYIRTSSARVPIPLANVVGAPTRVQVAALDVYTKEELYQRRAQELAGVLAIEGEAGAIAQVELAEYAERLFDYTHALDHYTRAAELDPEHRPAFISAAIKRATEKAALQEQVDYLADIDRLRARKRFGEAVELLNAFDDVFPDSPLMADLTRMRERVAKYQERYLREEIVRLWHSQTLKLTRAAVREAESYEEVLAILDGELIESLELKLVAELQSIAPEIEVEEIRRMWQERDRGRIRSASYGIGTWMLGEERALAVPKEDTDEEKPTTSRGARDEARKVLAERLDRYMKNQQVQRRAQGGDADDGAESPSEFWKRWSLSNRSQWALAYFVEFSGEFQVARVRLYNCRECGGTGAKEVVFTGSAIADSTAGSRLYRCSVCHGLGRVRRIQYR